LLDYFTAHQVATRAFDTETPKGTLKRFHRDVSEIVDVATGPPLSCSSRRIFQRHRRNTKQSASHACPRSCHRSARIFLCCRPTELHSWIAEIFGEFRELELQLLVGQLESSLRGSGKDKVRQIG
jgi:hypothetical protein